MTNAKLVTSQKAVDRLKPNSSIAKWSIRLLLSPLLPVYLIVSSLESLIRVLIVFSIVVEFLADSSPMKGKWKLFYIHAKNLETGNTEQLLYFALEF